MGGGWRVVGMFVEIPEEENLGFLRWIRRELSGGRVTYSLNLEPVP